MRVGIMREIYDECLSHITVSDFFLCKKISKSKANVYIQAE
jgi:hypothetical protein